MMPYAPAGRSSLWRENAISEPADAVFAELVEMMGPPRALAARPSVYFATSS